MASPQPLPLRKPARRSQRRRRVLFTAGTCAAAALLGPRASFVASRSEIQKRCWQPGSGGDRPFGRRGRFGTQLPSHGRVGVGLRALSDANLAVWFAEQLTELPSRVAECGAWGPVYFIATAAIAETLTFPVTPMMLTSGYIFGMPGVFAMLVSMSCAASMHFLLSRTFLRPKIEELVAGNEKAQSVNKAVEREGFKIMFLIRLASLLPSSITNFTFGLSRASYWEFLAAIVLGTVPYTVALVSSATVLQGIFSEGAERPWYLYAIGAVLYVGLLRLIADVAGKAIEEATQEDSLAELKPQSDGASFSVQGTERDAVPPLPMQASQSGA